MIINLVYDSFALAAPQSFRDGMEAAANLLEHHLIDDITVNINVGYGEYNNATAISSSISVGGPGASVNGDGFDLSYEDLRDALAAHNTSTTDATVLANLPGGSDIGGESDFRIGNAQARALGLADAHDGTVDGGVGMGTGFVGNSLLVGGLHELTHAMGRVANWIDVNWSVDLFRFDTNTLAGPTHNHVFGGNLPPPNAPDAYFSINGGTTRLADFGISSDPGDFLNSGVQGADPFNESVSGSGLTITDLIFMDALGFQVANAAPTVSALSGSVGEDGPSFSEDLLIGATDPDGDSISIANLAASINTAGGRHLTLGTDYTLAGSTIAFTSTGFAEFNSLAQGVDDTAVFDFDVEDFLGADTHNTLTVTINGLNDTPVANPDVGSAGENETKSFNVLVNDTDVDIGDTKMVSSIGTVTVTSSNPLVNGIAASSAFTIGSNELKFMPGTLFDHLAVGDTANVVADYTMQDNHGATASSHLTLTVNGANDAPVIVSGGGGDSATYFVRVNEQGITTIMSTDVDVGDVPTFSIVGGADASRFSIDAHTGELIFSSHPNPPNKSYTGQVQVSDGHGGTDLQTITVNVSANKMNGDAAHSTVETFVFHAGFGANTVNNFDVNHDFLQFDSGMFAADTAAAVLASAHENNKGDLIIDTHAGHLEIAGVTLAQLQVHPGDFLFV